MTPDNGSTIKPVCRLCGSNYGLVEYECPRFKTYLCTACWEGLSKLFTPIPPAPKPHCCVCKGIEDVTHYLGPVDMSFYACSKCYHSGAWCKQYDKAEDKYETEMQKRDSVDAMSSALKSMQDVQDYQDRVYRDAKNAAAKYILAYKIYATAHSRDIAPKRDFIDSIEMLKVVAKEMNNPKETK